MVNSILQEAKEAMAKYRGRVIRNDMEGGAWTLIGDSGVVYQLSGGDSALLKDGQRVEVQGRIAKGKMGIAMVGEILEVSSYRIVD